MDAHHHHTNPHFMLALKLTMAASAVFAVVAPLLVR
jgi:hypothetical protein